MEIKRNINGILGLSVITPIIHKDDRGYFMETYNYNDMMTVGLDMVFVQDNQSYSSKGVLRGLHYQVNFPQGKLVRVIKGKVFDVAVDLRKNSKTFGQWYGIELSSENHIQLYIPEGFAHGFLSLSEGVEFCYKCTDFYHPGDEAGIIWNDSTINIQWPIIADNKLIDGTSITLSDKDLKQRTFEEYCKENNISR
ncbi:MAG: dTDP-4-dehydrorhamnose 3,5-epimerase [Bacilli bacterium]